MTLQQLATRASRIVAVIVLAGAALGAVAVGVLAWHYTRPPATEGSPS